MNGRSRFSMVKLTASAGNNLGLPSGTEYALVIGGRSVFFDGGSANESQILNYSDTFALSPGATFKPGSPYTDLTYGAGMYMSRSLGIYDTAAVGEPSLERVLVAGGYTTDNASASASYWIDQVSMPMVRPGPTMHYPRVRPLLEKFTYTPFSTPYKAYIVAAGGRDNGSSGAQTTFEVYVSSSSGTQQWSTYSPLYRHEDGAVAVFPDNSYALLVGGDLAFPAGEGSELVNLQNGSFTTTKVTGTQPTARYKFASGWDMTGRFWIVGGYLSGGSPTAESWYFTPSTKAWTQGPSLPQAVAESKFLASPIDGSDEILILGGNNNGTAVDGYSLHYMAGSPAWTAISKSLWTPRPRGHQVCVFYVAGHGWKPFVYGGEVKRADTGNWVPDQRAREEFVQDVASIPFATTGSDVWYFTTTSETGMDHLTMYAPSGSTFHPMSSIQIAALSASNGAQINMYDVINSVSGAVQAVSGSRVGYVHEKVGNREKLDVYVPHGGMPNGNYVFVWRSGGTGSGGIVVGPINGIPPEFITISPGPGATAPGTKYTVTGRWMNMAYNVYFSNGSAYGNGIRFNGGLTPTAYQHVITTPSAFSYVYDALGVKKYLHQNTTHDVQVTMNTWGSLSTLNYSIKNSPYNGSNFQWTSTSSGNLPHGTDAESTNLPLFYFKLDEAANTNTMRDEMNAASYVLSSNWGSSQGVAGRFYGSSKCCLWRGSNYSAQSFNPSLPVSTWPNSSTGLRYVLGQSNWSVCFWYYSSGFAAFPGGYFGKLGISTFTPDANENANYGNGYLLTVAAPGGGPAPGVGPYKTVYPYGLSDPNTWYETQVTNHGAGYSWDDTNNTIAQIGFDNLNRMFISWDTGKSLIWSDVVYTPNPQFVQFFNSMPVRDSTWHFVHVDVNPIGAKLYIDGVKFDQNGAANVKAFYNSGPDGYVGSPDGTPNAAHPGATSVVYFGPLRDVYIDDLVLHRDSWYSDENASIEHQKRMIDRANALIY